MMETVEYAIEKMEEAERAVLAVRGIFAEGTQDYEIVDGIFENVSDGTEVLRNRIMAIVENKICDVLHGIANYCNMRGF
jgi:hypothetical protein